MRSPSQRWLYWRSRSRPRRFWTRQGLDVVEACNAENLARELVILGCYRTVYAARRAMSRPRPIPREFVRDRQLEQMLMRWHEGQQKGSES